MVGGSGRGQLMVGDKGVDNGRGKGVGNSRGQGCGQW